MIMLSGRPWTMIILAETDSNVYCCIDLEQINQNKKGKVKSNFAEPVFWEGLGWGFFNVEGRRSKGMGTGLSHFLFLVPVSQYIK